MIRHAGSSGLHYSSAVESTDSVIADGCDTSCRAAARPAHPDSNDGRARLASTAPLHPRASLHVTATTKALQAFDATPCNGACGVLSLPWQLLPPIATASPPQRAISAARTSESSERAVPDRRGTTDVVARDLGVVAGVPPWSALYNRPYLRCLHGYGLCLW